MHGWGADAQDLADLAYPMSLGFRALLLCAECPGALLDESDGPPVVRPRRHGCRPAAAGEMIEQSVATAIEELGLGMEAVALTGFSQGV